MDKLISTDFKSNTPVLPNVKIIDNIGYWDGPLHGICEIHDSKFFFMDLVESICRNYSDNTAENLCRLYAVYDINTDDAISLMENRPRDEWKSDIDRASTILGIFWEYTTDKGE